MRYVAFVCVSMSAIGVTAAKEPAPQFAAPADSSPAACSLAPCGEAERIRHLFEAAAHLVAAGKHDDATRLRSEAEEARQRLLTVKLAELANLQAEVDLLRAAHGELVVPDVGKSAVRRPDPETVTRQPEREFDDQGPLTPRHPNVNRYWDLTLDEALRTALANSKVLRNLGGLLVKPGLPQSNQTINVDITWADLEAGVRNFTGDLERAYWDLYYNYRNLKAVQTGRDSALATWHKVYALYKEGVKGGEAEKEAQAREQYLLFRAQVENSLGLLYTAESRLRYMMGLAPTDGHLIRPKAEPTTTEVKFDWSEIMSEALDHSVELRQQKWVVKQNELKLIASRNSLDRWGGFGGQFQNGPLGTNVTVPHGFRLAMAGVRNAELVLAASRARLQDEELELTHLMTNSIRDVDRNYQVSVTTFNRRVAAARQVNAVEAAVDAGTATLDMLLDAQRRLADAEIAYDRALVDYNLAIMHVHFRKNSLLEHNGIQLVERPWPRGPSTGPRPDSNGIVRQMDGEGDDAELLILVKPSVVEPAPELNAEFSVERARYDSPTAPSSRREPHPPRPFSAPSYQTPIRR